MSHKILHVEPVQTAVVTRHGQGGPDPFSPTMKLRVRSLETKDPLRVEIPNSQSLDDVKTLIAGKISSPSSPISPKSIRLSLNRTDEIVPSGPADSLQTLGLASGDHLFYSFVHPQTPNSIENEAPLVENAPSSPQTPTLILAPAPEITNSGAETPCSAMEVEREAPLEEKAPSLPETLILVSAPAPEIPNPSAETLDSDELMMEEEEESTLVEKAPSFPCLLKRVMEAENGMAKGIFGTIVVAIHAVFLESGFIVSDGNASRLPENWVPANSMVALKYTVPEFLGSIGERNVKITVLKLGKYVVVYGSVSGESADAYRLCLDAKKMESVLDLTDVDAMRGDQEKEKEIFKFWKIVKDEFSLPLMIDICEKNGLPPPPCFARLPTDLKLRVLELLPGVDVAKISCASSEMRHIASNDEIWKRKCMEEWGRGPCNAVVGASWKERFVRHWVRRKEFNKRFKIEGGKIIKIQCGSHPPVRPQMFPMVGGDYDLFLGAGGINPNGSGHRFAHFLTRRRFLPRRNLGGHGIHFGR